MTYSSDEQTPKIDYRARRAEKALERKSAWRSRREIVAALVVVAVLVVAIVAESAFTMGRIHPGVTVSGVRVGGMIPEKASNTLAGAFASRAAVPVKLAYGDEDWSVKGDEVGVTFDTAGQVARAMNVGREGNVFAALGSRVKAWVGGVDIAAAAELDETKSSKFFEKVAAATDIKAKNATVVLEGTEPKVVDGTDGRKMNAQRLTRLMASQFASLKRSTIAVPVVTDKRAIDAAKAQVAADTATAMLAGAITVTNGKSSWKFTPDELAEWIAFEETATPSGETSLVALVSAKLAEKPVLKAVGDKVGRTAKDARFKTRAGHVTIVPSEEGVAPNMPALADSLTRTLKLAQTDKSVELRMTRSQPKITTEKARSMGIKERISTFTTTYSGSNVPRTTNIHLLGKALDGALIAPGKSFSFNGIAGERTAAKGYQEAPAIVQGKLVPQLGGGVCQVGTTVFNAVFNSGLPVLERHNHSFYISHYPKGRDATVSWGGPDLKFKNDTKHWILVSVSYTNSSITVSLYGTDPGYEVTSDLSDWRNVKKFDTEETKDDTLAKGAKVVEDAGVSGRSITVTRTVKKDGEVIRTDKFVSVYHPKVEVVRVGTKPIPSKPAAQTSQP